MKLSLRQRLLRNISIPLVLGLLAIGTASYYSARQEAREIYDAQLAHFAHILHELTADKVEEGHLAKRVVHILKNARANIYEKDFSYRVWVDDTLMLESENADAFGLKLQAPGFYDYTTQDHNLRMFVLQEGTITVEVAEDYHARNDLLHQMAVSILLPFFFIIPLLVLAVCWGLRIGLKPLDRLSAYVARIEPDALQPMSIDISMPRELTPFVASINQLMQRVEEALEREKRFTGYAAHELRTPLAALKTQLQVALREKDADIRNALFMDCVTTIDRMAHLVSQLLLLLRSQKTEQQFLVADMSALVASVTADFRTVAANKNQTLICAIQPDISFSGSVEMLRVMVRNLLDNACRYSPEGAEIHVSLQDDAQHSFIMRVHNSGVSVSETECSLMFEPFYRNKNNQAGGAGLGLAIVIWIVKMHQLHITAGADADGLAITVYEVIP